MGVGGLRALASRRPWRSSISLIQTILQLCSRRQPDKGRRTSSACASPQVLAIDDGHRHSVEFVIVE
jgi:hypothetical protein